MGKYPLMKAYIVEHLGEAGTLKTVEEPEPGNHDVVLRITAAGINPVDWKLRDLYDRPRPFTLGQDFAGIVIGIGNSVQSYHQGDRVFGIARQNGAYAELTLCPVDDPSSPICRLPDSVGDSDAAAVPTPGLTAMACFEKLTLAAGSRIAILGATGALGQIAVQLARSNGLQVTGTGSERDEGYLRELGCVEYLTRESRQTPTAMHASLREIAPAGFDAIIDTVSDANGVQAVAKLLRSQGIIISVNHAIDDSAFDASKITALNVNLQGSRASSHEGLRNLAKMLESNAIRAPRFVERDFSDALPALEQVKTRAIHEKVVLTFR
jgi:NADPH:quinone reductase-like Zn-dependent oxidoreductase